MRLAHNEEFKIRIGIVNARIFLKNYKGEYRLYGRVDQNNYDLGDENTPIEEARYNLMTHYRSTLQSQLEDVESQITEYQKKD